MASEIYNKYTITLLDGTDLEIRPVSIKKLRTFMQKWTEFVDFIQENSLLDEDDKKKLSIGAVNDRQFDVIVELAGMAIKTPLAAAGKVFDEPEQYTEYLEETLDQDTIYFILDKAGGLKLGGAPNPAAGMMGLDGETFD